MDLMWNESIFTFPFSFQGGLRKWKIFYDKKKLDRYWGRARDIDSKYYLRYIYNNENRPIHYEYVSGDSPWNYEDEISVQTTMSEQNSMTEYRVRMVGLSLFVFPTGVGFITVRMRYPEHCPVKDIANFSAAFTRIFANERTGEASKLSCYIKGERYSFVEMMRNLVGDDDVICFFPCANNKKSFVFHRLIQDSLSDREKWALRRNLWITAEQHDADEMTRLEKIVSIDHARYYMLSSTVMWVVSKNSGRMGSEMRRLQLNIRFSYFNLYLLCIHEQQGVLLYNQKEVAIGKNYKSAKKIKNYLLRFLPSYSFRVVSTEIVYQQIFLDLQDILNLKELEENLRDNIAMLETAYEQERDQKLNILLTILAILGSVSVVADFLQLLSLLG